MKKIQEGIIPPSEVLPSVQNYLREKERYLVKRSQSFLPSIGFEVLVYNVSDHEARSTRFTGHCWRWGRRDATQNLF